MLPIVCFSFITLLKHDTLLNILCTLKTAPSWSNWGRWSECSASCGNGIRARLRRCSTRQNEDCGGPNIESSRCSVVECPPGSLICTLHIYSQSD